jgi:hypothetical protein
LTTNVNVLVKKIVECLFFFTLVQMKYSGRC